MFARERASGFAANDKRDLSAIQRQETLYCPSPHTIACLWVGNNDPLSVFLIADTCLLTFWPGQFLALCTVFGVACFVESR